MRLNRVKVAKRLSDEREVQLLKEHGLYKQPKRRSSILGDRPATIPEPESIPVCECDGSVDHDVPEGRCIKGRVRTHDDIVGMRRLVKLVGKDNPCIKAMLVLDGELPLDFSNARVRVR